MKPDFVRAEAEAKRLLADNPSFPVDLAQILKKINLNAVYGETDGEEGILKDGVIYIKKDGLPITRKKFSIAHEIGHFLLHPKNRIYRRLNIGENPNLNSDDLIYEQEANAFGAELLSPLYYVSRCVILGYSADDIANYFGISKQMAQYRYNLAYNRLY